MVKMKLKAFWGLKAHWKSLDGLCKAFCISQMPPTANDAKCCWTKAAFFGSWHLDGISKGSKFPGSLRQEAASFGKPARLQKGLQLAKNQGERHSWTSQQARSNHQEAPMGLYRVRVATGTFWSSGTFDTVAITLVGAKGESAKQQLDNMGKDFMPGAVSEYEVSCDQELGPILMIRLHKEPYLFFPEDSWYCDYVQLETPQGETCHFPCYQWIEGYRTLELREGTGKLACDDGGNALLRDHRTRELKERRGIYKWAEFVPGMPQCLAVESLEEMDSNVKFSFTKLGSFLLKSNLTRMEVRLKGLMSCQDSWKHLEDIRRVFWFNRTPVSEYVADHWQEDAFFGYQYLNGVNPIAIRRCSKIPANFPVTQEMVAASLGGSATLEEEVQKGNIFMLDYKVLQGIPTNTIQGQQQYMTAPLCLLYQTPARDLVPIAIQLSQTPGPDSPIFLPSDPLWDWTLAKMWVRNADFHVHQNISHLLRTHLLAEVFTMATLRQLPMCHPIFKLLIPHLRYTLQINALARVRLIQEGGMMDKATSAGYKGIVPIVGRGVQDITYASLCLPEDIEARGVSSVANYHYRDDAMKLWAAIERFVSGIVRYYYKDNSRVQNDPELQAWVQEIFIEAFRSRKTSGAPSSLETTDELIKFLTMVIFTCSAQHAAVNSGQFDFGSWIPNMPPSMRKPPPKEKGKATLESILETIPQVNTTCIALSSLWLLSNETGDTRPLGYFPDEHFTEDEPKRHVAAFQSHLKEISEEISGRNKKLPLPYDYLNPPNVENSVSI